ncbi:MAG: hypothetical protein PHQ00_00760 [Phycisphaerae bacterium]|nr:hypothetical protein [Phycisphaerae bacterium]
MIKRIPCIVVNSVPFGRRDEYSSSAKQPNEPPKEAGAYFNPAGIFKAGIEIGNSFPMGLFLDYRA